MQPPRRLIVLLSGCLALSCATASSASSVPEPIWRIDAGIAAWAAAPVVDVPSPVPPAGAMAAPRAATKFAPVQLLTDLANGLRNIRYRRGGRTPTSGFDCSGFVRYVFRQGIGAELPNTSAAQFRSGQAVARDALRGGDLVFFRTRGKHVSHVGIYLGDDRFIHAPSSGKTVSVSRLTDRYWARRYAGARRADVLVAHEDGAASGSS